MIVVSGDSFTAKSSNLYRQIHQKYPVPVYKCWPEILQEKLEIQVKNLALSGKGNHYVLKSVVDYLTKLHTEFDLIKKPNYVKFCIVGLSEWTRLDSIDFYNTQRKSLNDHMYDGNFYRIETTITNTLRGIYELQLLCEKLNITCVFFQMLSVLPTKLYESKINKFFEIESDIEYSKIRSFENKILKKIIENPYFSLIDKKYMIGWPFHKYLNGYNFFQKYLTPEYQIGEWEKVSMGKVRKEKDFHPNQDGHNVICEKVMEQLEKFKLI
jgi:hypothetical protein